MEQNIDTVMCVTTGDCSNTEMLMEVLRLKGVNAIPFAYPQKPDTTQMRYCLESLAGSLGTTLEAAEKQRKRLGTRTLPTHPRRRQPPSPPSRFPASAASSARS